MDIVHVEYHHLNASGYHLGIIDMCESIVLQLYFCKIMKDGLNLFARHFDDRIFRHGKQSLHLIVALGKRYAHEALCDDGAPHGESVTETNVIYHCTVRHNQTIVHLGLYGLAANPKCDLAGCDDDVQACSYETVTHCIIDIICEYYIIFSENIWFIPELRWFCHAIRAVVD